jgi:putative ABC transport system permease protein
MTNVTPTTRFRFWLWLIRLIGVIVPRRLRADWRQEWESELRHRELLLSEWDRLDWRNKLNLFWRSTSAFWDALWMQTYRWEDAMIQDLRFGVRMLLKQPGFTLVALLTLALGIGANTAVFSVANTVLLRPLPYQKPDELVMVWETAPKLGFPHNDVAPANFLDWRAQNNVFAQIAAFGGTSVSLTGLGEPERIEGVRVSASLFPLLGVAPALGRVFTDEEDRTEAQSVIVLSHGLWQRRFGGADSIVGQILTLNSRPYTVIGVMPASFRFPGREQEFWCPMAFEPGEAAGRGDHYLSVVARLKPGVTRQQAQPEMDAIAAGLQQQYPQTNTEQGIALVPLHEEFAGAVRKPLLILLGAVGFVLLIACGNVMNLLLARATTRRKELTIRLALGAGRLRLTRQLFTESLLVAGLGGVVGTLLALWGVRLLEALVPDNLAQARGIVTDWRVLGFSVAVSLLTGVVFGLLPALQVSRPNLTEALKEGGQSNAGGESRGRLRGALVIVEVALSLVLLVGAGLLLKSFYQLTNVDPGFRPEQALTMRMQLSGEKYGDPVKRRAFYDQMLRQLQLIPGVEAAAVITQLPLTTTGLHFSFSLEGQPPMPAADLPQSTFRVISQDYFRALGIPLLHGRGFTPQDTADAQAVVVINRMMAERFWPAQDVLGKRFKIGTSDSPNPWLTVVGVVGDVRQSSLDQVLKPEMYVSHLQDRRFFAIPRDLVVRTAGDPLSLAAAVRGEVWQVDKDLPLFRVRTMERVVLLAVAGQRLNMLLLTIFAALALVLAAVGIYGVMSYATAQRTHELGIRLALGAQTRDVLWLVARQGLALVLAGVALGLVAALALTHVLQNLLFGVNATDPATFAGITLLLISVACIASLIPARRATRVDPLRALRHD